MSNFCNFFLKSTIQSRIKIVSLGSLVITDISSRDILGKYCGFSICCPEYLANLSSYLSPIYTVHSCHSWFLNNLSEFSQARALAVSFLICRKVTHILSQWFSNMCATESPNHSWQVPHPGFLIQQVWSGMRSCISNAFPGDADLGTPLGKLLHSSASQTFLSLGSPEVLAK